MFFKLMSTALDHSQYNVFNTITTKTTKYVQWTIAAAVERLDSESESASRRSAAVVLIITRRWWCQSQRHSAGAVPLQTARISLALGPILTQLQLTTRLWHRHVIARRTQRTLLLVERLVAAFQHVQLRIGQSWVAVGVIRTVALTQETRPSTQTNPAFRRLLIN